MSVENMTEVSLFMFTAAGIFAVAAAVIFFSFDIPKCFRMVSGKFSVHERKKTKDGKRQGKAHKKAPRTQELSRGGETVVLETKDLDTALLKHDMDN